MSKQYKLLLIATLLVTLGDNLIGPMWVVFVQGVGGSILQIGYAAAIMSFSMGVFTILVGKLSDHTDKSVLTLFGYGLFAIGTLGYLSVTEPWHLYVIQVLFGIGGALLSAPLTALFASHIKEETAGFQWALEGGGNRIMIAVAVLVGVFIVDNFGFTTLFLTMFAIQLVAMLVQTRFYFLERKTVSLEIDNK